MKVKKLTLAALGVVSIGILGGCSIQTPSQTSNNFIEVHVQNKGVELLNINHIVDVQPSNSGSFILMDDTQVSIQGGFIQATDSYDKIVKELNVNQSK